MLTTKKTNIIDNLSNMNLFSYLQLKDKLNSLENDIFPFFNEKDEYNMNKQYEKTLFLINKKCGKTLFLDRYSLSSRIYDAAKAYLIINKKNVIDIINSFDITNDISLLNYKKDLLSFIKYWVFNMEYITDPYLSSEFALGYKLLENDMLNITHVLIKSSKIIRTITENERDLDQHEENKLLSRFINCIYDTLDFKELYEQIKHPFLDPSRYITVYPDEIILNYLNGEDPEILMTCEEKKYESILAITGYITENIKKL
jgi:hypothetical protein